MTERHHVNGAPEIAAGGYDAEIGAYYLTYHGPSYITKGINGITSQKI